MLTIGEISKFCRVSTKTLRHYDRIGLIKPIYVNEENGYRYYAMSQAKDIAYVGKMQNYGFTLSEISFIKLTTNSDEIRNLLMQKKLELERDIASTQYYLKQLEMDIYNIERGIEIMNNEYKVTTVELKPCNIASVRKFMGLKDFDKAFAELFTIIQKNNYQICGAGLAIYHSEDFDPENTDIESGIIVKENIGENIRRLDGGLHCMTIFVGPYVDFMPAYVALEKWIDENDYQIVAPPFEIYVKGKGTDLPPEEYVTEIYFPIKKK